MLALAQSIDKQHDIMVVTVRFDHANGIRGRKDKLIVDCERGGNYKNKNSSQVNILY